MAWVSLDEFMIESFKENPLPVSAGGTGINNMADAVVAQGTSGGWDYIKYANGIAILSATFTETDTNYATYNSMNAYYTRKYDFPFTFVGDPGVGYGGFIGSGYAINARSVVENGGITFYYLASGSGSQTIITHTIVIGRWK